MESKVQFQGTRQIEFDLNLVHSPSPWLDHIIAEWESSDLIFAWKPVEMYPAQEATLITWRRLHWNVQGLWCWKCEKWISAYFKIMDITLCVHLMQCV